MTTSRRARYHYNLFQTCNAKGPIFSLSLLPFLHDKFHVTFENVTFENATQAYHKVQGYLYRKRKRAEDVALLDRDAAKALEAGADLKEINKKKKTKKNFTKSKEFQRRVQKLIEEETANSTVLRDLAKKKKGLLAGGGGAASTTTSGGGINTFTSSKAVVHHKHEDTTNELKSSQPSQQQATASADAGRERGRSVAPKKRGRPSKADAEGKGDGNEAKRVKGEGLGSSGK